MGARTRDEYIAGHERRCVKIKRDGERCKSWALTGSDYCRAHGGNRAKGIANGNYKHGRYSKVLPRRLVARFEAALADPELLSHSQDLAVMVTRQLELAERLGSEESSRAWREMRAVWDALEEGIRAGDPDAIRSALTDGSRVIRDGVGEWAAWADWVQITREVTALRRVERERVLQAQILMRGDEVMALIDLILTSVRAHVSDQHTLAAIQKDVSRVFHGSA